MLQRVERLRQSRALTRSSSRGKPKHRPAMFRVQSARSICGRCAVCAPLDPQSRSHCGSWLRPQIVSAGPPQQVRLVKNATKNEAIIHTAAQLNTAVGGVAARRPACPDVAIPFHGPSILPAGTVKKSLNYLLAGHFKSVRFLVQRLGNVLFQSLSSQKKAAGGEDYDDMY